ncbi:hypothetical protein [Streptomyces sp. NPDC051572]|uniref:hypothetical protein n=1 Tax=Streptomyces sp. NPDC051572 TaxID=3155802 RepID=UPI00344C03BF
MITTAHRTFADLRDIDWNDTGSIVTGCQPAYDAITQDPDLFTALLRRIPDDPALAPMCERYDFMDKLVLYADGGIRVRLHLYRSGYFDRPHHHRWPFFSGIYRGQYLHRIFGADTDFDEHTDARTLKPIMERIERPGSSYALHHTTVHTVQADADTISILVRGPATRDSFLILDTDSGKSLRVFGAAQETPEQRAAKQMTPSQLTDTIVRVRQLTGLATSQEH